MCAVLGLAFETISADSVTPVWYNILSQGLVSQPLFSFFLSNQPGSTSYSEVTFGGVDPARYTGAITYVPLSSETYWEFALGNIQMSGKSYAPAGAHAICDTGTSLIAGPSTVRRARLAAGKSSTNVRAQRAHAANARSQHRARRCAVGHRRRRLSQLQRHELAGNVAALLDAA